MHASRRAIHLEHVQIHICNQILSELSLIIA
jgi:hypothetical protein